MKQQLMLLLVTTLSFSLFTACDGKEDDFSDNIPIINSCSFYGNNDGNDSSQIIPFSSTHKMKYTLNDCYKRNDYYEAVFRSYDNIVGCSEYYEIEQVNYTLDELMENRPEHYHFIVMDAEGPCLPDFNNDCSTLVFDVETGDYWAGTDSQNLNIYGKCQNNDYDADSQLISYVEGYWEFPKYDNFYEYMASMDWLRESAKDIDKL